MLLGYEQIIELLEVGIVARSSPQLVNPASLDVTLGPRVLVEDRSASGYDITLNLRERTPMHVVDYDLRVHNGIYLRPGQFILAHTEEVFNLPKDVSAEYHLKSSMARIGLQHLKAGWCDAGWNGSVLTLELKNITQYHTIYLQYGDLIGQMTFFRHQPVPDHASYAVVGRYNGDTTVQGAK